MGTRNSESQDALCRKDCSSARCSDTVIDSGEECDDGNNLSGDGCDLICRRELGAYNGQGGWGTGMSPFGPGGGQWGTQIGSPYQYGQIPGYPNTQPLPYNLPLAQIGGAGAQGQAPVGDTGPVAVGVMAAGAAAGFAWVRRKFKR